MDLLLAVRGSIVSVLPSGSFPGKTLRNQEAIYIQVDGQTGEEGVRPHSTHPFYTGGGWALTCVIKGGTARIHVLTWDKRKRSFVHRLHYALFRDGTYRVTPRRVHPIQVVRTSRRRNVKLRQPHRLRAQRAAYA